MRQPRQVTVGRKITVRGVDHLGRLVTEEVILVDNPVFTRTHFQYVGPYWWCRWRQLCDWLRWQLCGRWR